MKYANSSFVRFFVMVWSFVVATIPLSGVSATLALPDAPFESSSNILKPNFMYVLDNSYSMNYDSTNDALGTTLPSTISTTLPIIGGTNSRQCKVAMKDRSGNTVSALSRSGTVLTITLANGSYQAGNKVYLAVPYNSRFSGTYNIVSSNFVAATSDVLGCTSFAPASIGAVIKFNEHPAGCSNCGTESAVNFPACTVTTPQPANSGNTTADLNKGGGTDSSCYWKDLKDVAANTVCTSSTVITPGTPAVPGRVLTVDVENAGTSGSFSPAEVLDARIASKSDDNVCRFEPPQYSNQVNSLFYDPTVYYEPPPWPKNITNPSPSNLLPSMNRANTSNWTSVRMDGTKLTAAGDPYTAQNTTACNLTTSNRLSCNNTYRAPNGNFDFKQWREMVYCDTPDRPSINRDTGLDFSGSTSALKDKSWHESSHCKQNLLATNTVKTSPNYPYVYPSIVDGGIANPSKTKFYDSIILHQNGVTKLTTENPVADLYAFGEYYEYANPHYFKINPIEYCETAKLKSCTLSSTPTGVYTEPAYVRYCKTAAQATDTSQSPPAVSGVHVCQSAYTSTYNHARYGLFERIEVKPGNTFTKYPNRTDCAGSIGAGGCSYDEEMTNLANWYAYYRTRMQLMKSASGHAFNALGNSYRVGFMTINSPQETGNYLPINDFGTSADSPASVSPSQKTDWLTRLYGVFPKDGTPLRDALSVAGRVFAGKKPITALGFSGADPDPIQYACQQNFTLLTTDGYWNGTITGKQVDGVTAITNQDASPTARPKFEGPTASSNSLADVAKYYADTDIRDASFSNCAGAISGEDVCVNLQSTQTMKTYTLGLGVDGELIYKNSKYTDDTSGDYYNLANGLNGVNWPVPVADTASAVDDLWHAAVNSDATYFSAKSPKDLKESLEGVISTVDQKLKSASPPAVSSLEPAIGDYGFATSYVSQEWSGNLVARELSTTVGSFYDDSASVVWCADNKSVLDTTITACPGSVKLSDRVSANSDTRKILIKNTTGELVEFNYSSLDPATQQIYFNPAYLTGLSQWTSLSSQITSAGGDALVKYLRGQTAYEADGSSKPIGQQIYRQRPYVLGDITDSNPVFVGAPAFRYLDDNYASFASTNAGRAKTVYVGANDGMLHAFDAANGKERWAYIPSALLPKLHKLADFNYTSRHQNYVNGDPTVGDVCVSGCGSSSAVWKTILVGGLAQGGRGYYALDITDPDSPELLWEFNYDEDDNPDLGFTYGKPSITKKSDGTWVVLLTSGYNNGSAARLYVLNVTGTDDGEPVVISEIPTTAATDSGLAQISGLAIDNQLNNTSQYVYGGDLLGNLWKFDIDAGSVTLFATLKAGSTAQPITVAPVLVRLNSNDSLIIVGTGKLLEYTDISDSSQQTLYAIKDDGSEGTNENPRSNTTDFVQQTLSTNTSAKTRTVTNNAVDLSVKKGWFTDLDLGERQVVNATLLAGSLIVPTTVKSGSACSPEGYGWINKFNYKTGAAKDNTTTTSVGTYATDGITGIVSLVQHGSGSGDESSSVVNYATGSDPTIDPLGTEGDDLNSNGAFGGQRLIWRELSE